MTKTGISSPTKPLISRNCERNDSSADDQLGRARKQSCDQRNGGAPARRVAPAGSLQLDSLDRLSQALFASVSIFWTLRAHISIPLRRSP